MSAGKQNIITCVSFSCDLFVCLKAVCSGVFFITVAAAQASGLDHVTVMMSASGEGLLSAAGEDLEPEEDQDPSGMFNDPTLLKGSTMQTLTHTHLFK